jgi:hypothetical protein
MKSKSHSLPACICRFALVFVLLLFFYSPSFAKNITVGWDPNDEPDLGGYIVYRNTGSPGPPYEYSDDLPEEDLANPLNPMVTLTGLQKNVKYYVAVTAYDTDGNESGSSNDVCVQIINSATSVCSSRTSSSGGGGGGGSSCFINSVAVLLRLFTLTA